MNIPGGTSWKRGGGEVINMGGKTKMEGKEKRGGEENTEWKKKKKKKKDEMK